MDQQTDTTTAEQAAPQEQPFTPLTQEQRNDLRKLVLEGKQLTLEQAHQVYLTLRTSQGGVVITGETTRKKGRKKREGMSDAALDASLDNALKDI